MDFDKGFGPALDNYEKMSSRADKADAKSMDELKKSVDELVKICTGYKAKIKANKQLDQAASKLMLYFLDDFPKLLKKKKS